MRQFPVTAVKLQMFGGKTRHVWDPNRTFFLSHVHALMQPRSYDEKMPYPLVWCSFNCGSFNVAVIQGHCMLILLEQNNCNMEMEDTLSFDVTGLLHNSSMLATD